MPEMSEVAVSRSALSTQSVNSVPPEWLWYLVLGIFFSTWLLAEASAAFNSRTTIESWKSLSGIETVCSLQKRARQGGSNLAQTGRSGKTGRTIEPRQGGTSSAHRSYACTLFRHSDQNDLSFLCAPCDLCGETSLEFSAICYSRLSASPSSSSNPSTTVHNPSLCSEKTFPPPDAAIPETALPPSPSLFPRRPVPVQWRYPAEISILNCAAYSSAHPADTTPKPVLPDFHTQSPATRQKPWPRV